MDFELLAKALVLGIVEGPAGGWARDWCGHRSRCAQIARFFLTGQTTAAYAGIPMSECSATSTVASIATEAFSEREIKQLRSAFSSACRALSGSTPAGTIKCAVMSK
jgi:hypothetical protein